MKTSNMTKALSNMAQNLTQGIVNWQTTDKFVTLITSQNIWCYEFLDGSSSLELRRWMSVFLVRKTNARHY
jgi:hypothetical protein